MNKIAVIGMGYVGIPAAVLLAEAGFHVTGIQRRSKRSGWKIDHLNAGKCPIENEPELPELIEKNVREGRFSVTDDFSVIKDMDIVLIDVQTPTDDDHVPRYESLKEVAKIVSDNLRPGMMIVIESTVAPGTTDLLVRPIMERRSGLKAGLPDGFGLAFSYERVMVGRLVYNIRNYPKVVGGIDPLSTKTAGDMYRKIVKGEIYETDPMTAEVSKTVENAYRDVQIAFANQVALICESLGVNVYQVRKIVNGLPNDPSQPHANPVRNMHLPGAGVGGHCLPKDTWLLLHGMNEYGLKDVLLKESILVNARNINNYMPIHMVNLYEDSLNKLGENIEGSEVCVLGWAFLENSDDPRNTPSRILIDELIKRKVKFRVHDPFIRNDDGVEIEPDLNKALSGANGVLLMTKHEEYAKIDPKFLKGLLKTHIVIDGRDLFDPEVFIEAGFIFKGIGKGNIPK